MSRSIWDGVGEMSPTDAEFTTRDCQLRGRPYIESRVRAYMRRWTGLDLGGLLNDTVRNDAWLAMRNGYLVCAICKDVESHYLERIGTDQSYSTRSPREDA